MISRQSRNLKEITEAYNVLSDQEKKKLYDQYGFAAFEEGFGQVDLTRADSNRAEPDLVWFRRVP